MITFIFRIFLNILILNILLISELIFKIISLINCMYKKEISVRVPPQIVSYVILT